MSDDIANRLRCRYASGPIINGEPEFGYRDTSGPMEVILPTPIMKEAADEIERLRDQLHLAEVVRASQVEGLTQGAAGWRERANQLEAEVAGLREDAERYRWLRDCTKETELLVYSRGSDLDAAIDAALKGTT